MGTNNRLQQLILPAVFAAIGGAVYLFSQRHGAAPSANSQPAPAVVSVASVSPQTPDVETYLPPHMDFTPVQDDPRTRTDRQMAQANAAVLAAPDTPDPYVDLSVAYMQKARETADAGYLLRAEASCLKALQLHPKFYGAMQVIPWIYNTQHRFDEGEAAARAAQAMMPLDAWNFGTLGDALVQLGDYDAAGKAYDQMCDFTPDSSALTRVATLRELLGDPQGAISVINDAVATSRSDIPEHYAWTLVQRGNFHFNIGELAQADADYSAALQAMPYYHLALGGLGKARAAEGKYDEAISFYRQALDVAPYQETIVGFTDLLLYLKRPDETKELFELMEAINQIQRASHVRPGWLLVLFYADHDIKLQEALDLAQHEAATRKDIKTLDSLAWALYKTGRYDQAADASAGARRLGTKDALLYFHAGMIEAARGRTQQAIAFLSRAMQINPYFDIRHAPETRAKLAALAGAKAGP